MQNTLIHSITGANVRLTHIPVGSRLLVEVTGADSQVTQAANLMYNYKLVSEVSDDSAPYTSFMVTRKHFMRGLLALVMSYTERNNALGRVQAGVDKVRRAELSAAMELESMLSVEPINDKPSDIDAPMADWSHVTDDELAIA